MKSGSEDLSLWNFVERARTVLQIMTALVVVVPVMLAAWNLIQQGLAAIVPAWVVLLTSILGVPLGYLLGRRRNLPLSRRGGALVQRIDFEYQDSPLKHGWQLGGTDEKDITFEHTSDGYWGNVLEIEAKGDYRLDYRVGSIAHLGTSVEYVTRFEGEAYVYALNEVRSKNGLKTKDLWVCFSVGTQVPVRNDDRSESWFEWMVYLRPIRVEGGWLLFRIDLRDAVARSAGKEGWEFSRLKKIRLRGNQSLGYILISE